MFAPDIEKEIDKLFGKDSPKARETLKGGLSPDDPEQRVVRCIIVLGKDSLAKLEEATKIAKLDFRDVIYWAEYDKTGKRIANYNNPFPS